MFDDISDREDKKDRRRKNKDVDRKESKWYGKKIINFRDDDDLFDGDIVRRSNGFDFMFSLIRKIDSDFVLDVEEKLEESIYEEVIEICLIWSFSWIRFIVDC